MAYLVVVVLSVLVGIGVYAATLRAAADRPVALGFDGHLGAGTRADQGTSGSDPGYTYLRVPVTGPSWQERVAGLVGLLVLVGVSAIALALGIYQLGHIVNVTIEDFLAK